MTVPEATPAPTEDTGPRSVVFKTEPPSLAATVVGFLDESRGFTAGYAGEVHCEDFSPERGLGGRFRIILLEDGWGVLDVNGWRGPFVAPVLLCLNETDRPWLTESRPLRALWAQAPYFHSAVVNEAFDFEAIRRPGNTLTIAEKLDLGCFFSRSSAVRRGRSLPFRSARPAPGGPPN